MYHNFATRVTVAKTATPPDTRAEQRRAAYRSTTLGTARAPKNTPPLTLEERVKIKQAKAAWRRTQLLS
jgi:hypothetical protein